MITGNHSKSTAEYVVSDELLRIRIREQFKAEKGTSERNAWSIINSPIFLWFLSSVLIALAAAQFEVYKRNLDEASNLKARKDSLRSEITYRLDTDLFRKLFESGSNGSKGNLQFAQQSYPSLDLVNAICLPPNLHGEIAVGQTNKLNLNSTFNPGVGQSIGFSNNKQEQSQALLKGRFIYPEFKDRSIFSLMWELKNIESNPEQLNLLEAAINSISDLRKAAFNDDKKRTVDEYFEGINNLLNNWKATKKS